jgi:hypothetical protein
MECGVGYMTIGRRERLYIERPHRRETELVTVVYLLPHSFLHRLSEQDNVL